MKFKNAKVGDRVWSLIDGHGKITNIDADCGYSISVTFDAGRVDSFTFAGRRLESDVYPSLFWTKRHFVNEPDPEPITLPQLNVDDRVWVKDYGSKWLPRHFSHWEGSTIRCFTNGNTSWSTALTTPWRQWKLLDGRTNCPEEDQK